MMTELRLIIRVDLISNRWPFDNSKQLSTYLTSIEHDVVLLSWKNWINVCGLWI